MSSFIKYNPNNNKILIISFGGQQKSIGGLLPFEFKNFIDKNFNEYNVHFYIDKKKSWYHKGIDGITKNIDETIVYLKNIIKNYEKVIFIGSSAGGYASILFGSLLEVNTVLAFLPQTILNINNKELDHKYINLRNVIQRKTKYMIYGNSSIDPKIDPLHSINHCNNIAIYDNVNVIRRNDLYLKNWRDNGELYKLFEEIIN